MLRFKIHSLAQENYEFFIPADLLDPIRDSQTSNLDLGKDIALLEKMQPTLQNLGLLYSISYQKLGAVFRQKFLGSQAFNQMLVVMNQNMIEYRFFTQAGMLKV